MPQKIGNIEAKRRHDRIATKPLRPVVMFVSLAGLAGLGLLSHFVPVAAGPLTNGAESETIPVTQNGHQRMIALLKSIVERTPDENSYIGDRRNRQLRAQLAKATAPNAKRFNLLRHLANYELRANEVENAIDHINESYKILLNNQDGAKKDVVPKTLHQLGVAYMRLGETQNCCLRNTAESCILPFRAGAIHVQQEGSRRAIESFTEVLRLHPTGKIGLRAKWLLNIAYMTIGLYPDAVPQPYLIPPAAFASEEEFPRFANIAPQLKVNTFNLFGSVVVDDFDNDGYLDIITSSWDPSEQIRFFHNDQDGTFSDRTMSAGLKGLGGAENLVQADYNNDGSMDLFALRGAWLGPFGKQPNSLLRNNGDGTFTDVTFDAGLGQVHHPTQTAAWADYDNDGDLDLYVGNEHSPATPNHPAPGQLFQNNGDGTFTDRAKEAGVENMRYAKGVGWGDYDGDRFPDLYVSNMEGPNRLYRNNGDGTFTDVAPKLGVEGPSDSFSIWFWDFDNDGVLDLYVPSYKGHPSAMAGVAASYLGQPFEEEPPRLYRGEGNSRFRDVAEQCNLKLLTIPMGVNFGDLDNDGYLDFYLGTGFPAFEALMPNVMYRNVGGKKFHNVTWAGGFGQLQKGHGVAFADLDNDGDQDIFAQTGGAFLGDKFYDALYENPGFGHHWITVQLVGVRSNRCALGARIRVDVTENGKDRTIYKHVNSGGSFGANPMRQTIGLGRASAIRRLEIFWPTTNSIQSFYDVGMNQFVKITESDDQLTSLQLKQLKFESK